MSTLFSSLPSAARVWFYTTDRALTPDEQQRLLAALQPFFSQWTTHGRPVHGGAVVLHDRFLVIAGTVPNGDLSGCGIDASVHALESAAADLGFGWASALNVAYRDETGTVHVVPRPAFRRAARAGDVDGSTSAFDTTIGTLGDLRAGHFERSAAETWHATAFRLAEPA